VSPSPIDSRMSYLERLPLLLTIAGPNGAGKSTFFESHLKRSRLRFVKADVLAKELEPGAYDAAKMVEALRSELVSRREGFVFETVFDRVGEKVAFLKQSAESGYSVVLCFIGIGTLKLPSSGSRSASRKGAMTCRPKN
jgi:predicted ABC-type ATPase